MRKQKIAYLWLIFGYAFFYFPLGVVATYSFNSSRIMNVWQGFSLKWYHALFANEELLGAVVTSLKIASVAATASVSFALMVAMITVRFSSKRKPHGMLKAMVASPLVVPEVMSGLSLLLILVSIQRAWGWPEQRGAWSVTIAHITLGMSYAYLVIQARLQDFDMSIEEAAQDLGARPFHVFRTITLPVLRPSLVSAWLLAFALSLDDVVLASFLSGPGATTLPMLIFSNLRLGISPEMSALATIIMGIVVTMLLITSVMLLRQQKREQKRA